MPTEVFELGDFMTPVVDGVESIRNGSVTGIAMAASGFFLKKLEAAKDIAKNFDLFECEQCADVLSDFFKKNGIKGTRIEISTQNANGAGGNIWHDGAGKNISTNGRHHAVEVDGRVYDNVTPQGLSRSEWESNFQSIFGDIRSFKVKEEKF